MDNVFILSGNTTCKLVKRVNAGQEMHLHRGEIVESIVRRNHVGLSEISRKIGISRRTIYNWFKNENLSISDIIKIGVIIDYDFSNEFPALIFEKGLSTIKTQELKPLSTDNKNQAMYYWMEKYISLLEQYNEILCCKSDRPDSGQSISHNPA